MPGTAASITADTLNEGERAALHERLLELRERIAARSLRAQPPGLDQVGSPGPATAVAGTPSEFHVTAGAFNVSRNRFVPNTGGFGVSTVQEPAAHNEGKHILYTRNWNTQYSTNGGATWVNVPIPGGPADAPFFCCDQDVVKDAGNGTIFWSNLYINAAQTNGIVRIFVRRRVNATACFYDIDPAGAANNILPDYPHIALSNDFLYLTTNNIVGGVSWGGAQIWRLGLHQMAGCEATPVSVITWTGSVGQRIILPAEGAREVQYFTVGHESAGVLRLIWWRESGAAFTTTRAVASTNFANSDCRGGVGNFDWIESVTSWGIFGFRHRIAVGKGATGGTGSTTDADTSVVLVAWNAGRSPSGSPFPQAYVGQAVFREFDLALINNAPVWNSSFCFGYPAITSNKAGNFGISLFAGGRNGGGGSAQQGFVGIDDDFTPGNAFYQTVFLVASGDRNPSNARVGDYVTVHPHNPCQYAFSATSMALLGSAQTRNSRYVEFHRGRYRQCWRDWSRVAPLLN